MSISIAPMYQRVGSILVMTCIMIFYQSLWDRVYQPFYAALKNTRELERMRRSNCATAVAVAGVINDAKDHKLEAEEVVWKERIEHLRRCMNRSPEQLTIEDYGAQSPRRHLSDEAMYTGRVVTRTVGQVCRSSSKSPKWSLFLFRLTRSLKPRQCLELGSCLGISGAYIGAALRMNGAGSLVTIEGAVSLAERARINFRELGFDNIDNVTGRFQDVLGTVVEKTVSLEAVFIDGHHDGASTLRYFETIAPVLAPGAVVVFDDIGWSVEMHDAWRTLQLHDRVCASIDMFDMGICCIGNAPKEFYRVAI